MAFRVVCAYVSFSALSFGVVGFDRLWAGGVTQRGGGGGGGSVWVVVGGIVLVVVYTFIIHSGAFGRVSYIGSVSFSLSYIWPRFVHFCFYTYYTCYASRGEWFSHYDAGCV